MFIAHIPSGYIMAVGIVEHMKGLALKPAHVIAAGIFGAIAPDLDMAYFYLVDHRQTHHHKYATHWPLLWIFLLAVAFAWLAVSKRKKPALLSIIIFLGCVLHVILDSVVGDIWWFAPFIDKPYALFTVSAVFKPWWLNFVLHWSFALELAIVAWALMVYRRRYHNCERWKLIG